MIRMAGIGCLAAGSVLLGVCAVQYLNHRVGDLEQLLEGIVIIRRDMDYRLAPLPELLKMAAEHTAGRVKVLFELCARGAEHLNGRTFYNVWNQAIEASQLRLEPPDLAILGQLGCVLGRYDEENQRQALDAAQMRLEEQLRIAKEQSRKLGRVYSVLGLTAGAFLWILLI